VFQDFSNAERATVMKFDGGSWMNVGNPGFSAVQADYTCIAITLAGQIYVAYEDYGHAQRATVMTFNGSSWVAVGTPGFSAAQAEYISMAIGPDGSPYVVYQDDLNLYKATVMKFNGTAWVNVGIPGFTPGEADFPSIAFNPSNGHPTVAFADYADSTRATVMEFIDTTWVIVGKQGFSAGTVAFTSLAFSSAGQVFTAFQDMKNAGKTTVMKFAAAGLGMNEMPGPSFNLYPDPASTSITIDSGTDHSMKSIEIFDLGGKMSAETRTSDNKITLDIGNYSPGVYIVKLESNSATSFGKFCKN